MRIFLLVYFLVEVSRAMSISAMNSTHAILRCPPAENFIRTHMAPDFETPRLVRRLDWFQDDSLVATYQQNVMSDSSRQWWVADTRFQLIRPFYSLRVSPLTPEDSGTYRCRIETDPLFSTPSSTSTQELAVMVRPVAPSSPEIKSVSNRSITLVWTHNAARAHRPILRFLISVRTITNNSKFMLPAPSNATTVIVDNLFPYTLYAFAVQAENSAGFSEFGPETTFRTLGEAPEVGPQIEKIRNISANCVEVTLRPPEEMTGELEKYLVQTQAINETMPNKQIFDKPTSTPLALCGLHPETEYVISIEADNGFGTSPPVTSIFHTEPNIPNWSPTTITTIGVVGKTEITVLWDAPSINITKIINKYHLYYRSETDSQWKMENLNMNRNSPQSKKFKYRLVGLDPNTLYRVRVSASTDKGEGQPSADSLIRTDIGEPGIVALKDVIYDCGHGVKLAWSYEDFGSKPVYTIRISNVTTTLQFNTTQNFIDIPNLSLHEEYSVGICVVDRSKLDNSTILVGKYSESHRIILKDHCTFQSSLCSISEKCSKLTQTADAPKLVSIIIVIFSVILFMFICLLIAHFARGSMNLKHILKKKKEKCVYLEEISPLVYDSNGHEDIPVELFYGYVEDLRRNDDAKFRAQFEQIEKVEQESPTESTSSNLENLNKNRYNNIGANEATRIRLNSPNGSDYINANYIDSCEERNAYIATQAPLPSTFPDFWSMVWQERSNVIVCITNMIEEGKRKCDQYWPTSIDSPQVYGTHQVTLLSESTNSHFTHRVLDLKLAGSLPVVERKVHQLHFMSWPDHGVPSSVMPLLNFIHYTSDIPSTGPQIVHCSAGVGRSGSYILVDSMRRHLINFRRLNVIGHLFHMRRQRDHLVQTLEQYIFCHEAIRQLIRHGITRVHSDLFMRYLHYLSEENVKNGKTRMQLQYEDICECRHTPPCQIDENFQNLPGFHRSDEFIVGKWPIESEEIWRLCWKKNIQTVVLIGDCSKYWSRLEKVDSMSLRHTHDSVDIQSFTCNPDLEAGSNMSIKIINITQESLEADLWMEIENIQKLRTSSHTSPLLLISPNDLNFPVMICALTTLACQLETTGCVDIVQVLSAYSMIQCGIFENKNQIDLIYRMVSVLVGGTRV